MSSISGDCTAIFGICSSVSTAWRLRYYGAWVTFHVTLGVLLPVVSTSALTAWYVTEVIRVVPLPGRKSPPLTTLSTHFPAWAISSSQRDTFYPAFRLYLLNRICYFICWLGIIQIRMNVSIILNTPFASPTLPCRSPTHIHLVPAPLLIPLHHRQRLGGSGYTRLRLSLCTNAGRATPAPPAALPWHHASHKG